MKSKIIKILLSSVLSVWLIAWTVFALNTVNTWDTLTASSWNEIVNKLTSFDTNSTDLVTKSYVDSAISAGSWLQAWTIDWRDCETKADYVVWANSKSLICSSGYTIVDSFCSSEVASSRNYWHCALTNNETLLLHSDRSASTSNIDARKTHGSIKCCKVNQ